MWIHILRVLEMNLLTFGMVFEEVIEPNVWDVVPEIHYSHMGAHVKQYPVFFSQLGFYWECLEGGHVR